MQALSQVTLVPVTRPPRILRGLGPVTGKGVRVAVIDSGWDYGLQVPGLRLEDGAAFPERSGTEGVYAASDQIGHGTACATTVHRIAPAAVLCPVRVFEDRLEASVSALRAAILWVVERGFDVINLSLGTSREDALVPLYSACEIARRGGMIVIAASDCVDLDRFPAVFDNVISVSCGPYDDPFDYEYRTDSAVECLAASGIGQQVIGRGGNTYPASGASFAAPNITGIVALFREHCPGASLPDVRRLLKRFDVSNREAVRE